MKMPIRSQAATARGVTLIELLVAMVIGLVLTLAVTSVVIVGEKHKRTTTSSNDMGQSGAFATYVLDRALRSAGSGFAQSWDLGAFGCKLNVSRVVSGTATTLLPRSGAFPAPFETLLGGAGAAASGNLRLAPLLIAKNQSAGGSDVLVVMGGNGSAGDVPRPIRSGVAGTDNLRLDNTIGLADGDLTLVTQNGVTDCLLEQVAVTDQTTFSAVGNDTLPLGGQYFTSTGATTSLATFAGSASAFVTPLGSLNAQNLQFQLIGVGANRTLFSYDLLRMAGTAGSDTDALQSIADGVAELHAIYGLDTDNNGMVDTWVAPDATGYDVATLMTTPATLRQIVAVRVALVMRSANFEKDVVTPANLTLFSDLPAALRQTVTLTGDDSHYRYRVFDTTIPLRNMLLLPKS